MPDDARMTVVEVKVLELAPARLSLRTIHQLLAPSVRPGEVKMEAWCIFDNTTSYAAAGDRLTSPACFIPT